MAHNLPTPRHPAPSGDTVLALLAQRLTARDRWLIRILWEHHVFTTPQITQLAFPSHDRARHRMLDLARLGVVESIRILLPPGHGAAPLHHVLGVNGARVLAAEQGMPYTELGYRRDRTLAWAYSPRLAHLLGVNSTFTGLVATARHHQGARLDQWWSEQRCAETWGAYVRPDGYGRWVEAGAHVDFFLEYDTGTEPLTKVIKKLRGYAELAAADNLTTPVLIWTHSPTREANLHRHLTGAPVPVATTNTHTAHTSTHGPAGHIWLPAGQRPGSPRQRLIALFRDTSPED